MVRSRSLSRGRLSVPMGGALGRGHYGDTCGRERSRPPGGQVERLVEGAGGSPRSAKTPPPCGPYLPKIRSKKVLSLITFREVYTIPSKAAYYNLLADRDCGRKPDRAGLVPFADGAARNGDRPEAAFR